MPLFEWSNEKNTWLQKNRSISFEHLVSTIEEDKILNILPHPNKERCPNQVLVIFECDEYAWIAPCEYSHETILIKTIFAS